MSNKIYEAINQGIIPFMLVMAGASICLFLVVLAIKRRLNKKFTEDGETDLKEKMYHLLDVLYTVFIVSISLFPLLGMLGTVSALITLDISGASEDLKSNFFQALGTTGLGLIAAIILKFINAFFQPGIEECIAKAKKLFEDGGANE